MTENDVWAVGIGMHVDVWWCDGIFLLVKRKFLILGNLWNGQLMSGYTKPKSDLVSCVLSLMKKKEVEVKHDEKQSEVCGGDGVMSPIRHLPSHQYQIF
ncbi:unnamed protein product [Thlaspi arvense]|uniref:Uncharacterized protein n=1 Tax=Thlaspi arvense TaxID=13288 RepID=A0AAU9SJX1_THLAR|nr:unnamed protein product [Thlaspi arvense]